MEETAILNSPGLWAISSLMIIVLLISAIVYLKVSFAEAEK